YFHHVCHMFFYLFLFLLIAVFCFFFFFFNDPSTTEIYTLSLHDALPILCDRSRAPRSLEPAFRRGADRGGRPPRAGCRPPRSARSEEHTSELQSRENLVCRLLLEKKKKKTNNEDNNINQTPNKHDQATTS